MASITKRGKVWQARITWMDSSGKRHSKSKSGFKTKSQANQWSVQQESVLVSGVRIRRWLTTSITTSRYTSGRMSQNRRTKAMDSSAVNSSTFSSIAKSRISHGRTIKSSSTPTGQIMRQNQCKSCIVLCVVAFNRPS